MNKIIILNNKKCHFVSENEQLIKKLRQKLSFKQTGVEYTAAFQNGWSGYTFLMSKNNKFDFGLINIVKSYLTELNESYEVIDKRPPKEISKPIDISNRLKELKLSPRDHQIRIASITDSYDKGIVRAATGSGKTLATALITAKLNKPTIIYVIGLDLLKQFHTLFSSIFDEPIGWIGNGTCDVQRITIASIWTIGKALNVDKVVDDEEFSSDEKLEPSNSEKIISLLKSTKVHIFDESHIVTCNTIAEIYKAIDPEYIYGFSGTPYRDDNSDLLITGILGEKVIDVSASELIEKGLLAQPFIKFVTVPKMPGLERSYHSVYRDYIVENEERNNLILKHLKELLDKNYTPLVLFKQIKHGKILAKLFEENNINFGMLYGNDSLDKRNEVKEQLNNDEINVILASTIYDIGVDIPKLNSLILSGSGKSSVKSLQRIGRVVRSFPGKKIAAIVDFYDQAHYVKQHSLKRFEIYSSESGFKVIKSKEMK